MNKAKLELVLLLISLVESQPSPPKWVRPSPGVLPSPFLVDPELRECWTHLQEPPECMPSIYESYEKDMLLLSANCCVAVEGLSDRCFRKIFEENFFQTDFSRKVRLFCGSAHKNYAASAPSII